MNSNNFFRHKCQTVDINAVASISDRSYYLFVK